VAARTRNRLVAPFVSLDTFDLSGTFTQGGPEEETLCIASLFNRSSLLSHLAASEPTGVSTQLTDSDDSSDYAQQEGSMLQMAFSSTLDSPKPTAHHHAAGWFCLRRPGAGCCMRATGRTASDRSQVCQARHPRLVL